VSELDTNGGRTRIAESVRCVAEMLTTCERRGRKPAEPDLHDLQSMLKDEDLPPALRDQDQPPAVEELPLVEEASDVPPPAEPKSEPPAEPYLRRS
jgi:hypothetical protein